MFVCSECGASQPMAGACGVCGGSTLAGSEDPLLGASVGPYRIARLLGVGGMGRVYKGVQPQIGSRVAVKVLSRECTDRKDLVERFFSEARAVNLIRHESIVNVLDLAMLPDGRPYIVMEYLDGAPLSELVTRIGPMPLGGMARIAVEVLDALGAAHAKGIVHRDLKPDNVYITPVGRAKVLDFGIAKLLPELGGSFTQTGSLLGTPHYMSPEQASGKAIDARTDLYAMGVILFECATGQKPFVGDSMFDLLRKHVDVPPPLPRSLRPDLPPAVEHVILTALAKDPAHRFPTAAAMTSALQQATSGMPPEQWAVLSGSSAGIAPATPSGAGWGTPASWGGGRSPSDGGASAVSAPQPMPQPPPPSPGAGQPHYPQGYAPGLAHAPTAPYAHGHGHGPSGPGHQHHGQGAPYAGPPGSRHPSTATSGQVVGARRGGNKLLWGGLGLVAIGGVAIAVVLGSSSSPSTTPTTVAAGSADPAAAAGTAGSGSASPWAAEQAGSAGSAAQSGSAGRAAEQPATDVEQVNDDRDEQAAGEDEPAGGGDSAGSIAELKELNDLIAQMPESQRAMVRQQFEMVEAQLKQLPAAQRAMVLEQMRSALKTSAAQDAAKDASKRANAAAEAAKAGTQNFAEAAPGQGSQQVEADDDPPQTAPLHSPLPSNWNGKRFDVSGYLPTAVAAVKKIAPDAKLFRIDAEGVLPDGMVDLTQGSARYGFISKARAARPSHIPLGGKWDPKCQINVWVEADGINVREFVGCKETPVPMPRCSFKQRWQQMVAKGAPAKNAIAEVGYRAGVIDGRPIWFFDIGDAFDDGPAPDACP